VREWQARGKQGYAGLSSVLEKLVGLPDPTEVLALRPTPELQERLESLLARSRDGELSPSDQREWNQYEYVEHLVRLAKLNAARKLKDAGG
jgi:hypothetical protein